MLIGGAWHGPNVRFIIWGALHGVGLVFDKLWKGIFQSSNARWGNRNLLGQFFTFQFVCFAWIFFRARDMQTAGEMLSQMFHHFGFKLIPTMAIGYANVFLIIVAGFIIHWLPDWVKEKYRGWFIVTPIYAKVMITVLAVLLIIQFKSSVIQPFIYYQF